MIVQFYDGKNSLENVERLFLKDGIIEIVFYNGSNSYKDYARFNFGVQNRNASIRISLVNVLKKIQFLDANPFGNEFRDCSCNPELPIWNLNSTRIYDNQVIQINEL